MTQASQARPAVSLAAGVGPRDGRRPRGPIDITGLERACGVWWKVRSRFGAPVSDGIVSGGCCGLAGSWGFKQGKYGISMECGEQALLPAVRDAGPGTLLVANGFSRNPDRQRGDRPPGAARRAARKTR